MFPLSLFRLDGKVALVTGGGRGLGEYMANALADAGANIVLCSRRLEACESVAEMIRGRGHAALALACDIAEPDQVENVVDVAHREFGAVDVLVNNSGATWGGPAEDMPAEKFDRVMRVNVRGTFLMCQAVARRWIAGGRGGTIINISSVLGMAGSRPGIVQAVAYTTSKGAVIALTRDLAGSWAQYGIRVNCIAPGWFPTKMSSHVLDKAGTELLQSIPMGRFGEPADIQGAAVFLASPASAYVTGQTLVVDGGLSIW